jgi:hypothetical protein
MEELRALLAREKIEAREGASNVKIKSLLREKCALLEKELGNIKDNTTKCKK